MHRPDGRRADRKQAGKKNDACDARHGTLLAIALTKAAERPADQLPYALDSE
jgi:hypothetical protein